MVFNLPSKSYEVALIDTPLIQRLRQIRQTAFTFLTYPSSTHSRFEHTLGVVHQCTRLATVLMDKYRKKNKNLITEETIQNIRLAALLHDCGHGPFSHTSEEIYRYFPEIQKLIGASGEFEHKNPHEVLAYLIINSKPFQQYFERLQSDYDFRADKDIIANSIIKKTNPILKYKVEILNGPFDADKLDYVFRDSHFSGLRLTVDLDRLWYTAGIDNITYEYEDKHIPPVDHTGLYVAHNGIISLEQILFCKMILFSTIYHHPKVRACDCMLKGIIEYCQNRNIKIGGRRLSNLIDFLYLTDYKIFEEADKTKDKKLHRLIHNLLYRRLLKRALVITLRTVIDKGAEKHSLKLIHLTQPLPENYKELRELANLIWRDAGKPCLQEEIWVDLPKMPHNKEADSTFIKSADGKFEPLNKAFPMEQWVKEYALHKWRGHVFCPPDNAIRQKIYKSAKAIFKEKYGIEFNDYARTLCRVPHSIDIDS